MCSCAGRIFKVIAGGKRHISLITEEAILMEEWACMQGSVRASEIKDGLCGMQCFQSIPRVSATRGSAELPESEEGGGTVHRTGISGLVTRIGNQKNENADMKRSRERIKKRTVGIMGKGRF